MSNKKSLIIFAAAKMVPSQLYFSICVLHHFPVFKMVDIKEQESNSSIGNNEIINDISQAYVNSQPLDNFDKAMFLEEVRKYRCLWDVNSESYKMHGFKLPPYLKEMVSFVVKIQYLSLNRSENKDISIPVQCLIFFYKK